MTADNKQTTNHDLSGLLGIIVIALIVVSLYILSILLCRDWVRQDLERKGLDWEHIRWNPFGSVGTPFIIIYIGKDGLRHRAHCYVPYISLRKVIWMKDEVYK